MPPPDVRSELCIMIERFLRFETSVEGFWREYHEFAATDPRVDDLPELDQMFFGEVNDFLYYTAWTEPSDPSLRSPGELRSWLTQAYDDWKRGVWKSPWPPHDPADIQPPVSRRRGRWPRGQGRRRALSLPSHAEDVLRVLFPTLDIGAIRWIEGIPIGFRVGQTAITLGAWSLRRTADVFFDTGCFDPSSCTTLSVIVHEAAHVWQVSSMLRGRGLWILRPFYVRYVANWMRNGFQYERIRYEREAFSLQHRFLEAARQVAGANPDMPRGADGLPDPRDPGFAAALAVEWSKLVPFREDRSAVESPPRSRRDGSPR